MDHSSIQHLAEALVAVDDAACESYRIHAPLLIAYADQQLAGRADIGDLIGPFSLDVLYRNHADHAEFMAAQLEQKDSDALIATLAWAYRRHYLNGLPLRIFPVDLGVWRDAVVRHLDPRSAVQIGAVYEILGDLHSQLLLLAKAPTDQPGVVDELQPYFARYLQALLTPDMQAALLAAEEYIQSPEQIITWWECVIQPAMYEVGHLWAQGEISVGQEHLATAITQRVMAHFYPQILDMPRMKGRVVVAASPGELHEIGARVVSDLLELYGWDAYYTGASASADSILALLAQTKASFLCISTTLPTSLSAVEQLIAKVRSAGLSPTPQILVGGQAYQFTPDRWRKIGADGFARNAREGIDYIEAAYTSCLVLA
ncbi:cobalamin-dependent protein [Oscillochloris sp. ZM17-4]|uniref:cobalamin B12-binding domain-containing protein n=1 Tax=Oscillochloris sp. ZM17-4 TaxID=2866714 RepID=UPI001C72EA93|nr:cobalamin-dependent protein [Oscillochloris sp. ZM17-4]MBX0328280.1 cobalamin-dependent protein [Oscillochloris sp. ZM17-4]